MKFVGKSTFIAHNISDTNHFNCNKFWIKTKANIKMTCSNSHLHRHLYEQNALIYCDANSNRLKSLTKSLLKFIVWTSYRYVSKFRVSTENRCLITWQNECSMWHLINSNETIRLTIKIQNTRFINTQTIYQITMKLDDYKTALYMTFCQLHIASSDSTYAPTISTITIPFRCE